MQTPDEARATGEKLKELLLQLVLAHEKAIRRIDGTELKEDHKKFIDGIIESVHRDILPRYAGRNILLYEKGRSIRSFEVEFQRLWSRALSLYLEHFQSAFTPEIEKLLRAPGNELILNEYKNGLIALVQNLIVPLLEEHATPGDDFYLYTYDLMLDTNKEAMIKGVADTGKTPPQLASAFCGMFGLLIQAKKSEKQGETNLAYSFLLDANHLIGMHEGARYAMKHFDEVAAKRRAKVNSGKSRTKKDKIKMRALELFYSLRPTNEDGIPQAWGSANEAMEKIWKVLEKEALAQGEEELDISGRTILSLCQALQKRDTEGCGLDVRVEVVQIQMMPDGTKVKTPLD